MSGSGEGSPEEVQGGRKEGKGEALHREAEAIELDSLIATVGHFKAAEVWERRALVLTVVIAGFGTSSGATIATSVASTAPSAAVAGTKQNSGSPTEPTKPADRTVFSLLGWAALVSGVATAIGKAIDPEKRANDHCNTGRQYQTLAEDVRFFRTVSLSPEGSSCKPDCMALPTEELKRLRARRQEIHRSAPLILAKAWRAVLSTLNGQDASGTPQDVLWQRICCLKRDLKFKPPSGNGPEDWRVPAWFARVRHFVERLQAAWDGLRGHPARRGAEADATKPVGP
ncbi:hypothetical protein [Paracraurococcus lichenis]|uniref:Transmembrane protein n=1 Tax=Paracraurococcus lichenis TaxID=3064888 RepID=A0ABT9DX78_9PROT|nr:hypothetical protein [Paracraurococcus sp. LOR1-02]MDO9708500.1 hypothetical protein [Paracraurococcus sp. LOR1-02]